MSDLPEEQLPLSSSSNSQQQPLGPSSSQAMIADEGSIDLTGSSSSLGLGPPPVTYMANLIASHLMRSGAEMFGRQSDANCILQVGSRRYYVHVQMLASRSPTFRRIFDDMIANNAWGLGNNKRITKTAADTEGTTTMTDSESVSTGEEDMYYDEDEEEDYYEYDEDGVPVLLSNEEELDITDQQLPGAGTHGKVAQSSPVDQLKTQMVQSLQIQDSQGPGEPTSVSSTAEVQSETPDDRSLPELSVAFANPEESRFDELLYWLYTGNSDRWLASFTPQNYASILQNILFLNIVTRTVLEICLTYESKTHPDLGLHGMALKVLCFHPQQFQQLQEQHPLLSPVQQEVLRQQQLQVERHQEQQQQSLGQLHQNEQGQQCGHQ